MGLEQIFAIEYTGARDTDTHRVCGNCGELKPVEEFYRDGKDHKGRVRYRRDCKECYKVQRIYEAKMKEKKKK